MTPDVFGILMLIVLTLVLAYLTLSKHEDDERSQREREEYEAQRDRYIEWVRAKYAGDEPTGYRARNHKDFTGEEPLSPMELEQIKKAVYR